MAEAEGASIYVNDCMKPQGIVVARAHTHTHVHMRRNKHTQAGINLVRIVCLIAFNYS